ncbi:MAG: sigma-70 family RNA polymerase sigma factor [Chloroflexi bacterium]|nr:sigma-70 family RNA polymerase sigma factor [Chloroflexota bacterium]
MIQDETALAVQARCDPQAFAALFDRYYARVYNYIRYRCDSDPAAEDLTSQAFERLLRVIERFTPQRGSFEAWLFAIVRNIVSDYLRTQRLRKSLPWEASESRPSGESVPEEVVMERELHAQLACALPSLSERERDLLGLRYSTDLSNQQIAQITGLSATNVGVILYRAIERLRKALARSDRGMAPEIVKKETNHG